MVYKKKIAKSYLFQLFLVGFCKVAVYRLFNTGSSMPRLPPVSTAVQISDSEVLVFGAKMKNVINAIFFLHPGPCYYRSYTILYVLRNLGADIELHFGMINPFGINKKAIRAHCWMSFKGYLFLENGRVLTDYPNKAAERRNGITYWWGDPTNE